MTKFLLTALLALALVPTPGCDTASAPRLVGRAILPADTFGGQTRVGHYIDPVINDRHAPFTGVPIQGFSSIIKLDGHQVLALQDNGFGTLANSPDYPLRWYRLGLDFAQGSVAVLRTTPLSDPGGFLPLFLCQPDAAPYLHGADLDPESFVQLPDGTIWVGEEFGPWLVPFDAHGRITRAPFDVPLPEPLKPFGRGGDFYRTPDHPDVSGEDAQVQANLPRSGGLEGLAILPDGRHLIVAVEKALSDDPIRERRALLEFSPADQRFTGRFWFHRMDGPDLSIASLEAVGPTTLLIVERDGEEGPAAAIKRLYRVDLSKTDGDGFLKKTLVCDLLNIDDTTGLTRAEPGAFGLGHPYAFPYVTPECLAVWGPDTLLIANDNNYPFSTGRRPGDQPDDNEFILLASPAASGK